MVIKSFLTKLKSFILKTYSESSSPLFHGFTHEMQQCAFSLMCGEYNRHNDISALLQYPPDDVFIERCRDATRGRKSLQEYKGESGIYPPVGTSECPPTERQWKAT